MRSPSKNMCSVRQSPMPSAPNARAMRASCGVSAFARTLRRAHLVGPADDAGEGADTPARRSPRSVPRRHLHDLARHRRQVADEHAPGRAVERDPVALVHRDVARREARCSASTCMSCAADDRALAHAARDDGRVARHAAARGEHRARGDDAVEVLGRRLLAHEDRPPRPSRRAARRRRDRRRRCRSPRRGSRAGRWRSASRAPPGR